MCAPTSVITHANTVTSMALQYSVLINQLIGTSVIVAAITFKLSKVPNLIKSLIPTSLLKKLRI